MQGAVELSVTPAVELVAIVSPQEAGIGATSASLANAASSECRSGFPRLAVNDARRTWPVVSEHAITESSARCLSSRARIFRRQTTSRIGVSPGRHGHLADGELSCPDLEAALTVVVAKLF